MTAAELAERERSWATRVHQRRVEIGMTQAQLAELADVTQQAISRVEKGEVIPRLATMWAIASALGTSIEVLFPMTSAPKPKSAAVA
jgi:transcriptional regulator with XRE-family HTH domain